MEKLKNLFKDATELIKSTYQKFPITVVVIFIVTAIYALAPESFIETFNEKELYVVFALGGLGTLFSEIWFTKNNLVKAIASALSFIIAIILKTIGDADLSEAAELWFMKIVTTYVAGLQLLTYYKIMKNENVNLPEFGIKVLSNWGRCTLTYALANIGIGMVVGAFVALILDGEGPDGIYRLFVLLGGTYYAPALINTITDMSGEHGKFIKKLIKNVFTPVMAFLLVIFYMFIVKITLAGTLLESEMFMALSWGFAVGVPVVLLRKNYDDNEKTKQFTNILIYAFIPFIVLQIIGMGVRVSNYGLTTSRYKGFVLIIFETIFIALSIIKDAKYLKEILLVAFVMVIICVLSPFNFIDMPIRSQVKRLEKEYKNTNFESLSVEEKKEIKSIYLYIVRDGGEELLNKRFTEEELNEIEEYKISYDYDYEYENQIEMEYLYVRKTLDGADISNYSKIYTADSIYRDQEDYSKVLVDVEEIDEEIYVDFSGLMKELMDEDIKLKDADKYFEKNNVLTTSDGKYDIYITHLNFDYSPYADIIEDFSFSGYAFVKE